MRSNLEVSLENYFNNTFENVELDDKLIEKKGIIKYNNCLVQ